ncbi:MAG: protein-glutamate O-methyltransferase CheR [Spirochaetia bacterium]|nr:protein-glutamate O-methyltransferase CheR [Spirochaetia bacterium]
MLKTARDHEFTERVIDKITTHETRFFRDESIFDALVLQIIPEWLERKGAGPVQRGESPLHIWSAGCSTGQEPYSIAIMIREKFPALAGITSILATDISVHTLVKAERGWFSSFEADRGIPPHILSRYFDAHEGGYLVKQHVRDMIQFKKHNLIADPYPAGMDIALCRNVCIYFTETQKRGIFERLARSLKVDGTLILGTAESLVNFYSNYVLRECGLARYYEINTSNVTMFNGVKK